MLLGRRMIDFNSGPPREQGFCTKVGKGILKSLHMSWCKLHGLLQARPLWTGPETMATAKWSDFWRRLLGLKRSIVGPPSVHFEAIGNLEGSRLRLPEYKALLLLKDAMFLIISVIFFLRTLRQIPKK